MDFRYDIESGIQIVKGVPKNVMKLFFPFFLLMLITFGCSSKTSTASHERKSADSTAVAPANSNPTQIGDSTVHYYVNGKISVVRTPWEDGRRQTKLYDLYGELTYTIEETRLSYYVSAELKFYPNGAVETASIFTNPGASRFMHNSTIQFTSTNEPQWKVDKRTPAETIEDAMGDKYYWHKKEKRWAKQEVISCDPPRNTK